VARLRRRGARPGDRLLSRPRAALRPHQRAARSREARRGRLKGQLAARVGTAGVLIAGLLAALFLLPRLALAGLLALLLLFAALEWARLCRLHALAAAAYAAVLVAVFLVAEFIGLQQALFVAAALFWVGVAPAWMLRGVRPGQQTWLGAAGFAVLVPAGLAMLALRPAEVLAVLALVWIADTAAYFVGRAWGRRKLAPAISPGKSWEGAFGGLVGVLAYAIIGGFWIREGAWLPLVAAAALLAMVSIVGDLFESAAKRQAGVKDSGSLLPGHGGILDRIDSATAVLPLAALLWPLVRAGA
jgi:phosphatidate cytidylyltransferase